MDALDRLLAAPAAAPAPPDFLDGVHQRAHGIRRRRAAFTAGVTACLMLLAFLTGTDRSRSSLEPANTPLTPTPANTVATPSAAPVVAADSNRSAPVGPAGHPVPTYAVPRPPGTAIAAPPTDPWYWTVYRGTPPAPGQAGVRCVQGGGQSVGGWSSGPTGWCYETSTPDVDDLAPRSQQADVWYLGVWLCRASGAGAGDLMLDTPVRLVITRGEKTGAGWTDSNQVVFDSAQRWPARYDGGLGDREPVASNGCVLLQTAWDSRDSAGHALPAGLYFLTVKVADPAFSGWGTPKLTLDYRPGETH